MLLDEVLELLTDGAWHPVRELATALHQDVERLTQILDFFHQFHFITYDHDKERVMIDPEIRQLFLLEI